jgi:hypothetical protein
MSKQHSWSVDHIECTKQYTEGAVPVCNIHWKLTTKNTENYVYTAIHNGITAIDMSVQNALNLSSDDALKLVLDILGAAGSQSVEDENSIQLDNLIIPIIPVIRIS